MAREVRQHKQGFTLIELLVVVALMAVVMAIGVPSFRQFIVLNRLKAVNAELVTDLQFARSEAAARNAPVYWMMSFTGTRTCYSIYTLTPPTAGECRCLNEPNAACDAGVTELRTVRHQLAQRVGVYSGSGPKFAFDNVSGGLVFGTTDFTSPVPRPHVITTEVVGDSTRVLKTTVSPAGRPTTCSSGTVRLSEYPAC